MTCPTEPAPGETESEALVRNNEYFANDFLLNRNPVMGPFRLGDAARDGVPNSGSAAGNGALLAALNLVPGATLEEGLMNTDKS